MESSHIHEDNIYSQSAFTYHGLQLIASEEREKRHGYHACHPLPYCGHLLIKLVQPGGEIITGTRCWFEAIVVCFCARLNNTMRYVTVLEAHL